MADALDPSNPSYVGTDQQYREHAFDGQAPLLPEEPDVITQRVQTFESDDSLVSDQVNPTEPGWEDAEAQTEDIEL